MIEKADRSVKSRHVGLENEKMPIFKAYVRDKAANSVKSRHGTFGN